MAKPKSPNARLHKKDLKRLQYHKLKTEKRIADVVSRIIDFFEEKNRIKPRSINGE